MPRALRRRPRVTLRQALLGAALALLAASPAGAAELKVLTSGAFKPALAGTAGRFAADAGHAVIPDNDTVGASPGRMRALCRPPLARRARV